MIIFVLAFSLAGNAITGYSEYKIFSKLLINACEVINILEIKKPNKTQLNVPGQAESRR